MARKPLQPGHIPNMVHRGEYSMFSNFRQLIRIKDKKDKKTKKQKKIKKAQYAIDLLVLCCKLLLAVQPWECDDCFGSLASRREACKLLMVTFVSSSS
jgi:hypothetical protein